MSYREARQNFEREYFAELLDIHRYKMTRVARAAEMNRSFLYKKLGALGLIRNRRATCVNS